MIANWLLDNDTNSLVQDFMGNSEECIQVAVDFYANIIDEPHEATRDDRMHFNILTILHGTAEQILMPSLGYSAETDPEEMNYMLVDTPEDELFRMRDIAMVLVLRRHSMCQFIINRADRDLRHILNHNTIHNLFPDEQARLTGAIAAGSAAYNPRNTSDQVVYGALPMITVEYCRDIRYAVRRLSMNHFTGQEPQLRQNINAIMTPVRNMEFQMRRFEAIFNEYESRHPPMQAAPWDLDDENNGNENNENENNGIENNDNEHNENENIENNPDALINNEGSDNPLHPNVVVNLPQEQGNLLIAEAAANSPPENEIKSEIGYQGNPSNFEPAGNIPVDRGGNVAMGAQVTTIPINTGGNTHVTVNIEMKPGSQLINIEIKCGDQTNATNASQIVYSGQSGVTTNESNQIDGNNNGQQQVEDAGSELEID